MESSSTFTQTERTKTVSPLYQHPASQHLEGAWTSGQRIEKIGDPSPLRAHATAIASRYRDTWNSETTGAWKKTAYFCRYAAADTARTLYAFILSVLHYSFYFLMSPVGWAVMGGGIKDFGAMHVSIFLASLSWFVSRATWGIRPHYQAPDKDDPNKPVLFMIHGLGHNSSAWYDHSTRLNQEFHVLYANWGKGKDLDEDAEICATQLKEQLKEQGLENRDVIFVGHSTGYRLSRMLMQRTDLQCNPRGYVSVAGTTEGTLNAKLVPWNKKASALSPEKSKEFPVKPNDDQVAHIVQVQHDIMIRTKGLTEDLSVPRTQFSKGGHISPLYMPEVTDIIRDVAQRVMDLKKASEKTVSEQIA